MAKISIGKNTYICPGCFNDLSTKEVLYFCELTCSHLTRREILHRLAYRLTGAPLFVYFNISEVQRLQVEDSYEWIFTDVLTRQNKVPSINHKGKIYYGYGNNFENVLVKEWMVADSALRKFQQSREEADRNKFIAALYRPARTDGKTYQDPREPFDEKKCEQNEVDISTLPGYIKLAITINYAGVRAQTVADFPNVFKGGGSGTDFGIPGMVHDLSGPELGTVKDIEDGWFIRNLFWIAQKNEIRRMEQKQKQNA
jgi:hypothetical protein